MNDSLFFATFDPHINVPNLQSMHRRAPAFTYEYCIEQHDGRDTHQRLLLRELCGGLDERLAAGKPRSGPGEADRQNTWT
jgi:hypothetical protein